MTSNEQTRNKTLEIHKYFAEIAPPGVERWYRGHADCEWKLVPKAGREEFENTNDFQRFEYWRHRAVSYMPDLPTGDWEALAIAQHHGLATRLLDWTFNPLVAVYFACFDPGRMKQDGCVYYYHCPRNKIKSSDSLHAVDDIAGFVPKAFSARELGQQSAFTVHTPPTTAIEIVQGSEASETESPLMRIIPADLKKPMLEHLNGYGINRVTLFPDLDGLSHHVNWETEEMVRRRHSVPRDLKQ